MSGPSLRKKQPHHAIHEGGLSGAVQKTDQLKQSMQIKDNQKIEACIQDLVDYWETRILSHADAEEEEGGLYYEIAHNHPDKKEDIMQLTRDHDILRILVGQIKKEAETTNDYGHILDKFNALMIVNEIHSRDEERLLEE